MINANLADKLSNARFSIDDSQSNFTFYANDAQTNNLLSLRFDKSKNRFSSNLRVDDTWQEEQYMLNQKQIDSLVRTDVIPYLYKFATATQPVFILSENVGDKIQYRSRGITRTSNEKVLFVKVYNDENGIKYYGYGIFSTVESGIAYKDATNQFSVPTQPVSFHTPKGNTVYYQRLAGMFSDDGYYSTVVTINDTEYIIYETTFNTINSTNQGTDMQLFLLAMADFYLF